MTKTTRSLPSQRAAHVADRVPDAVRKAFAAYSRSELLSLRERNVNMLRRRELTSTLPDRGAKLQERIRQIDLLLQDESLPDLEITPENTLQDRECALTRGFTSLSLHTPQQLTRRRIVAAENARARANSVSSSSLSRRASLCSNSRDGLAITALQRRMSSSCSISSAPPSSTSSSRSFTAEGSFVVDNQPKVCMLTIDESIKLQEERHKAIEQYKEMYMEHRVRRQHPTMAADTLSTRMDRMSLDPTPEEDLAFLPPPPPPLIAELQSDEQDTHDIYAIQARIPYESIPFEGYSLEDGEEDWNHHGNRSL